MKFIDSHTHLQFAAYDIDREEVLRRAFDADVGIINVGTQKDTSEAAIRLAEKHPDNRVYATVGLHPIHTHKSYHDPQELGGKSGFTSRGENFDRDYYKNLASHEKVVAIGECGLDYFRIKNNELGIREKQKDVFVEQIKLAHNVKKPLMIHCRAAFSDLIETLIHNSQFLIPNNPGVIHFFSGTKEDAKRLLEMNFYFTFGGVITFVRDYDKVINVIPLEKILLETDAPYVTPAPHRGKRNEPAYVVEVYKKMAELKNIPPEKLTKHILENNKKIFNL